MMTQSYSLAQIAEKLQLELRGDANCLISGIAILASAQPGQISFLHDPKYRDALVTTKASAVVLRPDDAAGFKTNVLICANPYLAYAGLSKLFNNASPTALGIHRSAVVAESAKIAAEVSIGANCVIGENVVIGARSVIHPGTVIENNASLGEDCFIHANVSINEAVKIGSRVILHSGAVIGSDGFGNAHTKDRAWVKIYQLGSVIIGNDVEIGANTCIDRGALESTIIEDGVRLDNLIQIGHNVQIGAHTAIAGCTGIAGSTKVGRYCMIGGSVSINGHISICDGVVITGDSAVARSITHPGVYSSGLPAAPAPVWKKAMIRLFQLDDMARRLKSLEKSEKS